MQKLQEILENVGRLAKCGVAGWTVEPWPSLWRKSHGTRRNPPGTRSKMVRNPPGTRCNPPQRFLGNLLFSFAFRCAALKRIVYGHAKLCVTSCMFITKRQDLPGHKQCRLEFLGEGLCAAEGNQISAAHALASEICGRARHVLGLKPVRDRLNRPCLHMGPAWECPVAQRAPTPARPG